MPSVRVAAFARNRSFAFGATISMRRQVLARIGGFASIANQLADDYRLGELTRRMGLRTVLSEAEVETYVNETTFGELIKHEIRWLRTIRVLRPSAYRLSFITFGLPVTALQVLLAGIPLGPRYWVISKERSQRRPSRGTAARTCCLRSRIRSSLRRCPGERPLGLGIAALSLSAQKIRYAPRHAAGPRLPALSRLGAEGSRIIVPAAVDHRRVISCPHAAGSVMP